MHSFSLPLHFLEEYKDLPAPFGYLDAGGNSLGEITFLRTYPRVKEDGTKERWWEVCQRVIEGMYSIQKNHCKHNRLPWNDHKAQASAQEAYDRLFNLKWTPPGRGLWMMGTDFVYEKGSAALQNCAAVSSGDIDKSNPGEVFAWTMEALMLGVGVGWDTEGKHKDIMVNRPLDDEVEYVIPDSREGWVESLRLLINSYLKPNQKTVTFDYSLIRPKGTPIAGFGGVCSGPGPLLEMHTKLREVLQNDVGRIMGSRLIADIFNLSARCVVSANVRKGAELGLGDINDKDFINLKNSKYFPERNSYNEDNLGWAWLSNNSVKAKVGEGYGSIVSNIVENGEPGVIWLDITKAYGRLIDPPDNKDSKVIGFNPCSEQPLESFENCTLVELHLNRMNSKEDFLRTIKFAYLYAKSVTLLPTHWGKTNAVMQRNRRIGTSITSVASFVENSSLSELREWATEGYDVINNYDKLYSEWLGVRESIRKSSVKPSGSVSLLSGATPGVHWPPGGKYYLRSIRFDKGDKILPLLEKAGYTIEDSIVEPNTTSVVYFPIKAEISRSEKDVTIFEKIHLASEMQKYWSDNGVSATISFDRETEGQYVNTVLNMYEGQLKAISFLPLGNSVYPQQPYTQISEAEYYEYTKKLKKINTKTLYNNGVEPTGEKYCSNDVCSI